MQQIGQTTAKAKATAQVERAYTASDLLREVLRDYAKATETKRRMVFISRARDDDAVATQIIGNWFDRYKQALTPSTKSAHETREAAQQRRADSASSVQRIVAQVREVVLLDMVTPNGKKLRHLTGRECKEIGGWFGKIATKVKAAQKVGSALSEMQIRKLWSSAGVAQ
jgi:hypothetical protein